MKTQLRKTARERAGYTDQYKQEALELWRSSGRSAAMLAQHRLTASMSRKGNCYDNAHIESFWSTLKYELVYHHHFSSYAQARTAIFDYIETFYNRMRLHSSLAYNSPVSFESQLNQITLA